MLRTCIVTRRKEEKCNLVRLVWDVEKKEIVVDIDDKLPGRGSYICPDLEVFNKGVRERSFSRAFKKNINSDNIVGLENSLKKYICSVKQKQKIK